MVTKSDILAEIARLDRRIGVGH